MSEISAFNLWGGSRNNQNFLLLSFFFDQHLLCYYSLNKHKVPSKNAKGPNPNPSDRLSTEPTAQMSSVALLGCWPGEQNRSDERTKHTTLICLGGQSKQARSTRRQERWCLAAAATRGCAAAAVPWPLIATDRDIVWVGRESWLQ